MAITVNISNLGPNFENQQVKFLSILVNKQIEELAKETERVMRDKIRQSIQRPGSTDNLAMSIFAEKIGDNHWGVGNINYLNSKAKYWKWLNYGVAGTGRTTPPATLGQFNPGGAPDAGSFRKGRWEGGNQFFMIPKNPIQAHNYIERTLAEIPSIILKVLGR